MGVETILFLFSLKICYPNSIFLLRGNHECRQMTFFHNFRMEAIQKYGEQFFDLVLAAFDVLPIAALINGHFLAVHGGISPSIESITTINQFNRNCEPPQNGPLCDLLWADPVDNDHGLQNDVFTFNTSRGCSFYFGYHAVNNFIKQNNIKTIIRAHEAQFEGFKAYCWQKQEFPQVITLFSAPNYCGCYANKGAIIRLDVFLIARFYESYSV